MMRKPSLRASNLDATFACPGSRTLSARVTAGLEPDDEMTLGGTWCHYRAARRLVDEFGALEPAGGLEAPLFKYEPDKFAEWMVRFYVETVTALIPSSWAMEVECELAYEFPNFILTGHVDCYGISADGTEAIIPDLKTGTVPVDPADQNWQLFGYLVLLTRAYPGLKRARILIIQPRNREDSGYQRVSETNVEITPELIEYFIQKVNTALANPYLLETGYKQCRFCPAQLICPALREEVKAMKLQLTLNEINALETEPSLETLGALCAQAKAITGPLKKAHELLKSKLEATGQPLTLANGTVLSLQERNGPRSFSDMGQAWSRITTTLPMEAALRCVSISFTDLEAEIAAELHLPKTSQKKESAESYVKEGFGDITVRPPQKVLTIT